MKANTPIERLLNGIVKENPTLVLLLGMCPTLAVTTSGINGAGMGLTTTAVLMCSNAIISALRKVIPDRVRIPAYIVIVATLVTMVQFLLEAYLPSLNSSLGIYIPLIVVNCIILGRAESYASKNPVIPSFFDGVGMGLGFTCPPPPPRACRELLGAGQIFGIQILPEGISATIFILAPGAFLVLAFLIAILNRVNRKKAEKAGKTYEPIEGCGDCQNCSNGACSSQFYDTNTK